MEVIISYRTIFDFVGLPQGSSQLGRHRHRWKIENGSYRIRLQEYGTGLTRLEIGSDVSCEF
jgi:hypothetical protein